MLHLLLPGLLTPLLGSLCQLHIIISIAAHVIEMFCLYVAADELSNVALLEKIKLLETQLESKVKKDTSKDAEETSTPEKREGISKYLSSSIL